MLHLSSEHIEAALKTIPQGEDYIFNVLRAYGLPKSSITRLQSGELNLSKVPGNIMWRGKLCYEVTMPGMLKTTVTELEQSEAVQKYRPRFIIVSDGTNWAAVDTKTKDRKEFPIADLPKESDFFLPWAGFEKAVITTENPADIKAAQRMGKLFDQIRRDNPKLEAHDLNVFLARLLFCYFAEDSGIFPKESMFTRLLESTSQRDGSDLHRILQRVFDVMNTPMGSPKRKRLSSSLAEFPYVNGGLFQRETKIPKFSTKSRDRLIEAGHQNWADINTDIFGNMFQACLDQEKRKTLGEHYTSVPNIMKVLRPLFLDDLETAAIEAMGNPKAVDKFINRLCNIRFFDPACGSGNFLLVAFKEVRKLEMEVLESVREQGMLRLPSININQFYGIEIDDFAHEIAVLSLWLVDHQMNQEFSERFGQTVPTLPLKPNEHIMLGNALQTDWQSVCPPRDDTPAPLYTMDTLLKNAAPKKPTPEVYIFGNPPYAGSSMQSPQHKADLANIFKGSKSYRDLDYVSCWFKLAAEYISANKAQAAFVSTNSIVQGEHVSMLWEPVLSFNVCISFAYKSFKWQNNAKYNAGVTCVIVGLAPGNTTRERILVENESWRVVPSITPYLTAGDAVIVHGRKRPFSADLPEIVYGNKPTDGGHLILTPQEKDVLLQHSLLALPYVKRYMGSADFLQSVERYCLWITNADLASAQEIPEIKKRLKAVSEFRKKSQAACTVEYANTPHLFKQRTYCSSTSIIVPAVSSERRPYIPFGFLDENTVISNSAFAIYNAQPWVFAVISSAMHMAWVKITCGRLKTDYRYSAKLCYNTFPLPSLTDKQKQTLHAAALEIMDIRERHTEMTLGEMYSPERMPEDLKLAHENLDVLVDRLYRKKPFATDEERLEVLFPLYKALAEAASRSSKDNPTPEET